MANGRGTRHDRRRVGGNLVKEKGEGVGGIRLEGYQEGNVGGEIRDVETTEGLRGPEVDGRRG